MKRQLKMKPLISKKTLVFDGQHLAYRCHYTLPNLRGPHEKLTGCIYGVLGSVFKAQRNYPNHKIIFTWDTKENIRKEMYPEYKANRKEKPEWYGEFIWEIEQIKKILKLHGIDQFEANKYEADDIAAYLVNNYKEYVNSANISPIDRELVLVTSDSDWKQLLYRTENVVMHDPIKSITMDENDVKNEYSIDASFQLAFIKAIKGDTSDNVPKINRFPSKLASELARKFATPKVMYFILEGINPEKIIIMKDKWRDALLENKEQVLLNYKLVALGAIKPKKIIRTKGEYSIQRIKEFYKAHGFTRYLSDMTKETIIRKGNLKNGSN